MVKNTNNSYPIKNESSIQEIRKIILGLEMEELLKLQAWVKGENRFSEDVAEILPAAIRYKVKQDNDLETVLVPIIEDAIFSSVKNNPDALAEALYPVMAPAIRRSISEAIRAMLESINQTLESTFSTDRMFLRVKSWVSGKSYAELLLAKSGFFKVKHVFLMEKETGLLIEKVSSVEEGMEEADMVSAMLTAIQDFVKDVFSDDIKSGDTLDTIKIQDLNVWIQEGSAAVLVVVTDGNIPESYRPHFREQLEKIHIRYGSELKKFTGVELQNGETKPLLESCLIENEKVKSKKTPWKMVLAFAFLIAIVGIFLFVKIRDNRRFERFASALNQKTGVIVTDNWKDDGLYYISGLKDVSLQYFGDIALSNGIDSTKIYYSWETFISNEPQFVLQRFEKVFSVHNNIVASIDSNGLKIAGEVNEKLRKKIVQYFELHSEYGNVNLNDLLTVDTVDLIGLKTKIESISLNFKMGRINLSEDQQQKLDILLDYYRLVNMKDKEARLSVLSYTLNKDSSILNNSMAISRAKEIVSLLKQKNVQLYHKDYEILNDKNKMREVYFKLYLSK